MALNKTGINYSGKELGIEIIRESFSQNLLHTEFGARILSGPQGGKSTVVWHDAGIDLTIRGKENCPTFDSNFELTQNEITLCEWQVAGSIENDALVGTYRERNLASGALNESTPDDTELMSAFVAMLTENVAEAQSARFLNVTGGTDWSGSTCSAPLMVQFEDDTLNNPVPANQRLTAVSAITANNVQTELNRVINAMPSKYRYRSQGEKPKIAVSANIADAYLESLTYQAPTGAAGAMGANVDSSALRYRGYELVVIFNLGDNEMFMTLPNNIGLVFDNNDMTNLLIRNGLDDSSLCDSVYWRLNWRAGAFFGKGDAVVVYK